MELSKLRERRWHGKRDLPYSAAANFDQNNCISEDFHMAQTKVQSYRVTDLWRFCRDCIFAIPEIQREFVWDRKRVANLFDSIWRQLPIGTLLIWETDSSRRHLLRTVQQALPAHRDHNKHIWFIIDGQQRLAALYRAVEGGVVKNYNGQEINFDQLCFVFDKRFDPCRFGFVRKPQNGLHVPVKEILLPNWRRHVRRMVNQQKFYEIEKFRDRLQKYSVPVVFVDTTDLGEVRETFLRINSGGLRISKADRAFSRAARLDMRRLVKELRAELTHGFNEIDPVVIQASVAVMRGQKEVSGSAIEKVLASLEEEEIKGGTVSKEFSRSWRRIRNAIAKSVDYLCNEMKVINRSFLPSDNIIPVLSYFFYTNNLAQPTSRQRREIRKWFWGTGVAGRYSGRGYYQNIRKDLDFMRRLASNKQGTFFLSERMPKADVKTTDYSYPSSLTSSYLLMLCLRGPKYLENGSQIPLKETSSVSNRKDKHHIFPKALLRRYRFSTREVNSLCNLCFVVAEENQSIGNKRPSVYLRELKQPKFFASVMKSHLIPYQRDSGLWDQNVRRGYKKFLAQRLDAICNAFEKEAGMQLFRRD